MDKSWAKDYPTAAELTEETLDENSSLKKMLHFIGENKRVVDFGCATGYFAQLLSKKGCVVTGVEINSDAAKIAERYCNEVIIADLDFVSISEILPNQEFDVAVFGDVLEHLRNPWRVLKETKNILKENGYVVASIPNIAHGAIRLALLKGKFEYMELGILDNTHLRFFTRKTVEDLFNTAGYFLDIIDCTKLEIFSESNLIPKVNINDFNSDILQKIQADQDADTLQFIIKAYPMNLEKKYALLNNKYSKLIEESEILQVQLQKKDVDLEMTKFQLQQTQTQVEHTTYQLQQTQTELENITYQLQQTQAEFEKKQAQLQQIQTQIQESIFGKLKRLWLMIKHISL